MAERNQLELEVAALRGQRGSPPLPGGRRASTTPLPAAAAGASGASAKDALNRLLLLSQEAGTNKHRNARQLIAQLEKLVEMGPAAVPEIRALLQQNQDVVYQTDGPPPGKGPKWKQDTAAPASLRAGLIDTLRRIGGAEAEQVLAETLGATSRGFEVYSIGAALEELAPGKYRDALVSAAQNLLAAPAAAEPGNRLEQQSRNYLYEVLQQYGDATVLAQMAGQLVTANGTVNEGALKVLEKGAANVTLPAVYQALQDARLTDAKQKEPLLELAMNHVGADQQAGEIFMAVMQSQETSPQLQQKALRHLANEGLENEDAPTARDLQVLQSRLQYLDAVKPSLTDAKLQAEWEKARGKITNRLAPPPAR